MEKYEIRHIGDHYAAYLNGVFICSGDSRSEIQRELESEENANVQD